VEQLRLAYFDFSLRLRDDFQSAALTCLHRFRRLSDNYANLLVLFTAFLDLRIMPQTCMKVNDLFQQCIPLCSHDEIIFVKSSNLMRPPIDDCSPVFCNNQGMRLFIFGNSTDFAREF